MKLLNLLVVALMPVLKTVLITALGLLLALDRIKLLVPEAIHHLNNIIFYVLLPALSASNLAETITWESFITLWFMPVNLFLIYILGSALAWVLIKITKTPKHLQGVVVGCCSAGNTGNLLLIIIPAVCQETGSPFGNPSVCSVSGKKYAALSLSVGDVIIWSYVYGIMRMCVNQSHLNRSPEAEAEAVLPSVVAPISQPHSRSIGTTTKRLVFKKILVQIKMVCTPTAIGAIIGFIIGIASPLRKLLIGNTAPLRAIDNAASLLGVAAISCMTLNVGANLLKGIKGSNVNWIVIVGIMVVRNIILPLLGIGVFKAAKHLNIVGSDVLYQFVLLLQYAVPPAMAIGTISEFFQTGQGETSMIMLWTYGVAVVTLTLWSTFFMWLLA